MFSSSTSSNPTMARPDSSHHQPHITRATQRSLSYPRKRAVTACESCRTRKMKCSNERPVCSACTKLGTSCSYDQRVDHSSFDPASLLILEKLNELLYKFDNVLDHQDARATLHDQLSSSGRASEARHTQRSDNETLIPRLAEEIPSLYDVQIPSSYSSTDSILAWPVFGNKFPRGYLAEELFIADHLASQAGDGAQYMRPEHINLQKRSICEEDIPELVDRFLYLVHVKNPILDTRSMKRYASRVMETGLQWDAPSCVVLLACALGSVASPFDATAGGSVPPHQTSTQTFGGDLALGENYYQLACKRLGLLDRSILACQCYLLSGIYLMYTMRPLQAWFHFHHASSTLSTYLKGQTVLQERRGVAGKAPECFNRRLEQRLYWSCLKSECEMHIELDLPVSELFNLSYPYMFPSPPTPSSPLQAVQDESQTFTMTPLSNTSFPLSYSSPSSVSIQKAEERSWFYYLSELALRRLENRVLHAFYKEDNTSWSRASISDMAALAANFEIQHRNWEMSLPEPISLAGLATEDMDELRYMNMGRYLNIQSLLYRPFLYYAVHHQDRSVEINQLIQPLVQKALKNSVGFNRPVSIVHRHHGAWLACRQVTSWALLLLAARSSGLICWNTPTPGSDYLDFPSAFQGYIATLKYWEAETPDIAKAREILEALQTENESRQDLSRMTVRR